MIPGSLRACWVRAAFGSCLIAFLGLSAPSVDASGASGGTVPQLPPVLEALVGEWEGTGTLMGQSARFEMSWRPALGERFVRLGFRNVFVQEDGAETAVLEAAAYYLPGPDGASATGSWFDTRGLILPLSATLADSELVTLWGDAETAERGRTTYRVLGPDRAEVIDEVVRDGEYVEFGRAVYERVGG